VPKLVWRVKLVAELEPGVATETEVGRFERGEEVGLADLGLRLEEARDRPEPGGPYADLRNERRAHRSAAAWSWPRLAGAHPPHPQVLDGLNR
jgi:hypothetical protein